MDTPRCECHGEPMLWNRKPSRRCGGTWHCRVVHNERHRRRHAANPEPRRARMRAYYEENALAILMKKQLRDHRNRQAELEAQLNG